MREKETVSCEICGDDNNGKTLIGDLCPSCDTMLACFNYDPELINAAIEYIEYHARLRKIRDDNQR